MNDSVMDLSIVNLAIAYIFVLLLLIIFRARGIRRENMILIATTQNDGTADDYGVYTALCI